MKKIWFITQIGKKDIYIRFQFCQTTKFELTLGGKIRLYQFNNTWVYPDTTFFQTGSLTFYG